MVTTLWFPRSSVETHTMGRVQSRNSCRYRSSGMHSHAGAWERGGAPWFPRSSVGAHTMGRVQARNSCRYGSAGMHSHAGAWERGGAAQICRSAGALALFECAELCRARGIDRGLQGMVRTLRFPRSSVGTHTMGRVQARNSCRCGSAGMHSHAGAWERGGVPWFPRSSVGTHTEAQYRHKTHAGT